MDYGRIRAPPLMLGIGRIVPLPHHETWGKGAAVIEVQEYADNV